ncbi:2,3-bisphosphoglycerate-dependent phosphoglycerate mutase [Bacillus sp. SORGH_AS 510]|uniref:2,3-diphosphoglycerate-dependent phosphoglycerate mutase n=1 Tax=Bacillus sp. SORGH_AS_0510 TaxID=3041771 RepID=UPI00278270C9|nr:2,3-diphosphoglycerate-dependent phosphoglycerate mutase [Bacillus sp. SORGH_AS_0510]MDQ1147653.1 2,3-bisphosphoglycerate-dependent phosphoglycerate mutase [Bacillus sp. SORGH_AS_0510]
MKQIVFIRHGQSLYNLENRFTGWTDVDLTDDGYSEARDAGAILKKHGFIFDVAHTSVLKRAIRTLWILLHEMDLVWIPVYKSWRLNERHYGALQGLNKSEVIKRYGEDQVNEWRRSASICPPEIHPEGHILDQKDPKYAQIGMKNIPLTESLLDTEKRTLVYWHSQIVPNLQNHQRVIISAHGNTLRALVKYLDNIPDDGVVSLNIPNSIPLVYELDYDLHPIRHYYLDHDGEVPEHKIPRHMDVNDPETHDWIG